MSMMTPTPVAPEDARQLLEMQSFDERQAYAKKLGVRNVNPPLPPSPCVRIKATGMVLPWNELLAEQSDLCECCDETGNTDPAAWQPKVRQHVVPDEELHRQAQSIIMAQGNEMSSGFTVQNPVSLKPATYPDNVVPFSDMLDASTTNALLAVQQMA